MKPPVKFSVITPVLNRRSMVGACVDSVRAQGRDDVEHIVIDAASTDGTLDVLRGYDHLDVVSESDRGIYDGMNKGLDRARGEILVILNSDDMLLPGALDAWEQAFANHPQADMASGAAELCKADTGERIQLYDKPENRNLSACEALLGLPIINARAFKKTLWDKLGGFNLSLPVVADRDWLVRAALCGAANIAVTACVYRYQAFSGSATFDQDAGPKKRLAYAREAMALAEKVYKASDYQEVRRAARILNDKSAAQACVQALKLGDVTSIFHAIMDGFKYNPVWPVSVFAMALNRMLGGLALRRPLEGCSERLS